MPEDAGRKLEFEVASLRLSGPKSERDFEGGPGQKDAERYRATVASLRDLIAAAWNVDFFQISSSTPLEGKNFDLIARVPPGATREQFRAMLQNLLIERFGLKVHLESREFAGFELAVGKNGAKLSEKAVNVNQKEGWPALPASGTAAAATHSIVEGYELVRVKVQQVRIAQFTKMIRASHDQPVVDQTGLPGLYTFSLEYTKEPPGANPDAPPVAPSLRTALQQQLGLQLVSKKLPFPVVVVDAVRMLPSEN